MARKSFSSKQRNQFLKDASTGVTIKCSCGNPAKHIHHIVPVCKGGTDDSSNLEMLCQTCHVALHSANNDFAQWGKKGGQATAAKKTSFRNLKQFRGRPDYLIAYVQKDAQ